MSCLLGENRDIFFPKLSEQLDLTTFSDIAERYLCDLGYEPIQCDSEKDARERAAELISEKKWPCYFFKSDTTGEKDFEEFFTDKEDLNLSRFEGVGLIRNQPTYDSDKLDNFALGVARLNDKGKWDKQAIIDLFFDLLPEFAHKETGKYLDQRM